MTGSIRDRLKSTLHHARARSIAARHGNPAAALKVIVTAGATGAVESAYFLAAMLSRDGKKTAVFTYRTIEVAGETHPSGLHGPVEVSHIQQFLKSAKDAEADYAILALDSRMIDTYPLTGVELEAVVMAGSGAPLFNPEHFTVLTETVLGSTPRYIVLNRDDELFESYQTYKPVRQVMTYGTHRDAEAKLTRATLYKKGSDATLLVDHQTRLHLVTALPGKQNMYYLMAAATMAYLCGASLKAITDGGADIVPEQIAESEVL